MDISITNQQEEILKNNIPETYYTYIKEKILDNKNIQDNTKNEWIQMLSQNYILMDVTKKDKKYIMDLYNKLEKQTLEILKNDKDHIGIKLLLSGIKLDISIKLNRALIN